jgi:large subunit ribosomal protein L34e
MVQRLTYRRSNGYNTKSNRVKIVKTPGGRLVYHHVKKQGSIPKCGDCGARLRGLPAVRPIELSRLPKHKRTINRAYGGSRCGKCVRTR